MPLWRKTFEWMPIAYLVVAFLPGLPTYYSVAGDGGDSQQLPLMWATTVTKVFIMKGHQLIIDGHFSSQPNAWADWWMISYYGYVSLRARFSGVWAQFVERGAENYRMAGSILCRPDCIPLHCYFAVSARNFTTVVVLCIRLMFSRPNHDCSNTIAWMFFNRFRYHLSHCVWIQ